MDSVYTWDKLLRAVQPSLSSTLLNDHCVGGRIISKAHRDFGVEEAVYSDRSQVTTKKMWAPLTALEILEKDKGLPSFWNGRSSGSCLYGKLRERWVT